MPLLVSQYSNQFNRLFFS